MKVWFCETVFDPTGLLNMVVEPYLDGRLPDIMMVPISISYERTFEEQLFARELLGTPKPKESTSVRLQTIITVYHYFLSGPVQ